MNSLNPRARSLVRVDSNPAAQGAETKPSLPDGVAVVLAAIDAGELVCPAATRRSILGAVLALNTVADRPRDGDLY
jgi:hypothetical protein